MNLLMLFSIANSCCAPRPGRTGGLGRSTSRRQLRGDKRCPRCCFEIFIRKPPRDNDPAQTTEERCEEFPVASDGRSGAAHNSATAAPGIRGQTPPKRQNPDCPVPGGGIPGALPPPGRLPPGGCAEAGGTALACPAPGPAAEPPSGPQAAAAAAGGRRGGAACAAQRRAGRTRRARRGEARRAAAGRGGDGRAAAEPAAAAPWPPRLVLCMTLLLSLETTS